MEEADGGRPGGTAWGRLAWFACLYGAAVLVVGAVAYLLRAVVAAAG